MRSWCLVILMVGCAFSARTVAAALVCLIQPSQEADLGTQAIGVVDQMLVERGALVKKGQPVALLNADVERAQLNAVKVRASANAELQAAALSNELAQRKKRRSADLYRNHFLSLQARDQAETDAQVAQMQLEHTREQQRLAQHELALAQAQVAQRSIRSPFSGVVVERYLSAGERAEQKPIVRIAMIDPLRVDVIVPAVDFGKITPGMIAIVGAQLDVDKPRSAKVIGVDRMIDPASNSFRVRLELPNLAYELAPGQRCKIDFDMSAPTASMASAKTAALQPVDRGRLER
jgi:RND family efflux transporter MFP subunit